MKVRTGFVSNSSSSSFILRKNNKFSNTVSIAKNMVKQLIDDYQNYHDTYYLESFLKENLDYLNKNHPNVPIMFKSTNYDTYISDIGDGYFYINTCNNIDWDIQNEAERQLPSEVEKRYGNNVEFSNAWDVYFNDVDKTKTDDYDTKDLFIDIEYYKLDSGFFVQKTTNYKYCRNCSTEMFRVGGKDFCLNCDGEKILRSLKLKKINNRLK